MKRILTPCIILASLLFTLTQCRKDNVVGFKPTYAIPLVEANLSIGDVIGARPNEVLTEYAFGTGADSTFFFKLIYTDTLEPLSLLQFQNTGGGFAVPVSIPLGERRMFLRMLGKSNNGEFVFSDPSVEFVFDNYTTMAYDVTFDSIYTLNINTQNRYYFQLTEDIEIAAGDPVAGGISKTIITNENTNPGGALSVVFEPTPKYLYYYPVLTSKPAQGQVLYEGNEVRPYAKVILPFEGRGKVTYRDTLPYTFEEDLLTEVIDFAFLRLAFDNGIPLEVSMTGSIVDTANYNEIATLPLYDPATNDFKDNSIVVAGAEQLSTTSAPTTAPKKSVTDIRIYRDNPITGKDDIDAFASGNAVIIQLEFETSGYSLDETIKIFSSQRLKLNMGIKTRINGEIDVNAYQDSLFGITR